MRAQNSVYVRTPYPAASLGGKVCVSLTRIHVFRPLHSRPIDVVGERAIVAPLDEDHSCDVEEDGDADGDDTVLCDFDEALSDIIDKRGV